MPITTRVIPIPIDPLLDAKAAEAAIAWALAETGAAMQAKLNATTSSWRTRVTMAVEQESDSVTAGPEGEDEGAQIWAGVDQGTSQHVIAHRRAPFLQFPWQGAGEGVSYQAATKPRKWASGPHYRFGKIRRTLVVDHPGIYRPREWSDQLAVEEAPKLTGRVQAELDKVTP
jgi:hypothetical protein